MPLAITLSVLEQAISWIEYYALAKSYVKSENKPELYRNEKMLKYTADNIGRMDNILRTITIEAKLYNTISALKKTGCGLYSPNPGAAMYLRYYLSYIP